MKTITKIFEEDEDFIVSVFEEWCKNVDITYYEHDYEKKIRIVKYVEK